MPRLPKHFVFEDLELSGPKVWPTLQAHDIPSRYIHQRPELTYLSARKEALARAEREDRDPADADRIRVTVVKKWKRETSRRRIRGQETRGYFVHSKHLPPKQDVREFLKELDSYLRRKLPKEPVPGLTVQLRFTQHYQARGKSLGSFQALWW
jgi:hypothetical protein